MGFVLEFEMIVGHSEGAQIVRLLVNDSIVAWMESTGIIVWPGSKNFIFICPIYTDEFNAWFVFTVAIPKYTQNSGNYLQKRLVQKTTKSIVWIHFYVLILLSVHSFSLLSFSSLFKFPLALLRLLSLQYAQPKPILNKIMLSLLV